MTVLESGVGAIPVDYATAVERFIDASALAPGSRRVYRIALHGWAWSLVDRVPPYGGERRGARAPTLPLSLLDHSEMTARVLTGVEARRSRASPATAARELSMLRSAVTWWRARGWLGGDPTAGITAAGAAHGAGGGRVGPVECVVGHGSGEPPRRLVPAALPTLLALRVPLRESVLWRLLLETGRPTVALLALDVHDVRPELRQVRIGGVTHTINPTTGQLLGWLVLGRPGGPVFLTHRRAGPRVLARDRCPTTGRARLSYRRAAELFTAATRPLTPDGRGWTLHQLSAARRDPAESTA